MADDDDSDEEGAAMRALAAEEAMDAHSHTAAENVAVARPPSL